MQYSLIDKSDSRASGVRPAEMLLLFVVYTLRTSQLPLCDFWLEVILHMYMREHFVE